MEISTTDDGLDGSKKQLNFDDVTLTFPKMSENPKTSDIPTAEINVPTRGVGEKPTVEELRQEVQRIRQNLAGFENITTCAESYVRQLDESNNLYPHPEPKELFYALEAKYAETLERETFLKLLTGPIVENRDESSVSEEEAEIQRMREELTNLKQSNEDTIQEIESLITKVAYDMNTLDSNLSLATESLEKCDLEIEKLAESEKETMDEAIVKQSATPEDLEETIRLLEEHLRQNEKEYEDTEAALKQRIEQYNLEMEELKAQGRQLDIEEESLRLFVDISSRCLKVQPFLESISDVAVLAVGDDFVELQLTTEVPFVDEHDGIANGRSVKQELQHKLFLNVDTQTMDIKTAELTPADVPIDDLVPYARQIRGYFRTLDMLRENVDSTTEVENAEFGRQFSILVRAVHHRVNVFALKAASLSSASKNPRYSVEYLPESSVVTATISERVKAMVEVPQGWPMQGFSLHLQSLQPLKGGSPAVMDFLREVMELSNKMPEYARHDLVGFIKAIEDIITERNSQTNVLPW
ncbi:hypothetical protein R1sor_017509 [Riccia sorocarpa]|uniref:Uncharacterized protein n=1 Tax=Riccia sorocarpa TaxID=122646 RepID=A0ABD3I9U6_9MARC